ncbi:hypothetical protein [Piscibacillus salipiscarius]|uniref:hypothetical protein n=1 Tax=Piscibacillus salipiscarius TaxID=299480 RepID=UPI0006D206AE|nr:hypothetical protein [Piscibacillus salipiscarius]
MPAISTAAALCLAIIVGYQFVGSNETADQIGVQNNESSSYDTDSNQQESVEKAEEAEGEESKPFSEQPQAESNIIESSGPRLLSEEQVVSDSIHKATLIIPGPAAQYFVPLTYFIPENNDPYTFFNQQDEVVQQEELKTNLNHYAQFVGTNNKSVPIVQVDETQLQGSASELALSESLSYFQSLGHEQIQLQDSEGKSLDLPHSGTIDQYTFDEQKYAYKLFETKNRYFWVRKRLNQSMSMEEAIDELKINEKNLNVIAPIPKDLEVNFSEDSAVLEINIHSKLSPSNQESVQRLIEAMLLTAGSFGYNQIQFTNLNMNQVGPYDLTEPIHVPEYINVQ